jgi:hypothetical protein
MRFLGRKWRKKIVGRCNSNKINGLLGGIPIENDKQNNERQNATAGPCGMATERATAKGKSRFLRCATE